jgi:hypothetical protein
MRRLSLAAALVFALALFTAHAEAPAPAPLPWQPWSDAAFAQARAEHKFVLLDLEAVWCHWCHVMDDVTYKDPAVRRLLLDKYILVKVDQDSRPDIANRYQDYGWPATVVFAGDGSEIVKRQGYIPPHPMASMLQAIIDDPSPGPSVEKEAAFEPANSSALAPGLLKRVQANYEVQYDKQSAGWGFGHKYLDSDSIEYAMRLAAGGDATYAKKVADTLQAASALIDPVWGGMYQYSVDGNWTEPHFEKLISIQAQALRIYSLAYAQSPKSDYLKAAQAIHRYVSEFLSDSHGDSSTGVFFVSQDADLHDGEENASYFKLNDEQRRAQGIPRIDKHVYARENGWMIAALCDFYAATGDATALTQAERAAQWIVVHRSLAGGGFRHGDADAAGPYLGDTLAMGQAFLALYNVTGDESYLDAAAHAEQFIGAHFAPVSAGTGFLASARGTDFAYPPHPDRDENSELVRFSAAMALATGDASYQKTADEAMRYIAASSNALRPMAAPVLLADQDATEAPLHVTVLGSAKDPAFAALHDAALRSIRSHELIEIRDLADPRPTAIAYPALDRAALFLCTARACSSPTFRPEDVRAKIERAERQAQ